MSELLPGLSTYRNVVKIIILFPVYTLSDQEGACPNSNPLLRDLELPS